MNANFVVLLVEDNSADIRLTEEALENGKVLHELHVVTDGIQALSFLRNEDPYQDAPKPDLILLDLNLPGKTGKEVLVEIKEDSSLTRIPVVILSSSAADEDVLETYDKYANGYIVKPIDVDQFFDVIKNLKKFWMSIVMLPPKEL